MNKTNKELMNEAKVALDGKWGTAIGGLILYSLAVGVLNLIPVVSLFSYFISPALALGLVILMLTIARGEEELRPGLVFDGLDRIIPTFLLNLVMGLIVLLYSLLLIVPGVIKAYSYSMALYIYVDNPDMKTMDILRASEEMMDGQKMKFFFLQLRFIPLFLLCIITLGIGFLWAAPYMSVTIAKFYDDLVGERELNLTSHLVEHI